MRMLFAALLEFDINTNAKSRDLRSTAAFGGKAEVNQERPDRRD
jgi:hypothetical protein